MPELPSLENLAQLPLRAIVVYAVRCARRVQPLFRLSDRHLRLQEAISAVNRALSTGEDFAIGREIDSAVAGIATHNVHTATDAIRNAFTAARAGEAVYSAAEATLAAIAGSDPSYVAAMGERAAAAALAASAEAADNGAAAISVAASTWTDLTMLVRLNLGKPGELGEPIDATENGPLGPLWPDGPPDWYVEGLEWQRRILERPGDDASEDQTILPEQVGPPAFVIAWDPELVTPEEYAELVGILGDLVREEGGAGVERVRARGMGVPTDAGVLQ